MELNINTYCGRDGSGRGAFMCNDCLGLGVGVYRQQTSSYCG